MFVVIRPIRAVLCNSFLIACCVAASISACADRTAPVKAGPETPSAIAADSLLVSLDDVRQISGSNELTSYAKGDLHQPGHHDSDAPAPCRVAYDQETLFGNGLAQFRSMTYSAVTSPVPGGPNKALAITQAVGVYPDGATARTTYDRLVAALPECSALHAKYYEFTVASPDSTTTGLDFPERQQSKFMYRVKSSVLIEVTVQGFAQSDKIAGSILETITDRIR
jgi:hypothetical protein